MGSARAQFELRTSERASNGNGRNSNRRAKLLDCEWSRRSSSRSCSSCSNSKSYTDKHISLSIYLSIYFACPVVVSFACVFLGLLLLLLLLFQHTTANSPSQAVSNLTLKWRQQPHLPNSPLYHHSYHSSSFSSSAHFIVVASSAIISIILIIITRVSGTVTRARAKATTANTRTASRLRVAASETVSQQASQPANKK